MRADGDITIERLVDVGRFDISPGFCAITRSAELRQVLASILGLGAVVTVAVRRSVLVGYLADLPFLPIQLEHGELRRRWQGLPQVRELGALEVARPFRGAGLARRLVAELSSATRLDDHLLLGEGLEWHWDLAGRGLAPTECRARLLALFAGAGFCEHQTDEPEVAYSANNFLIARAGARVRPESLRAFQAALFSRRASW